MFLRNVNIIQKKITTLRIICLFILAKIYVEFIPLKYYYNNLIVNSDNLFFDMNPIKADLHRIYVVGRMIPWKVTCIMQAIAAKMYFRRYKIEIPIYLGIDISNGLRAHAWNSSYETNYYYKLETKQWNPRKN